MHTDTDILSTGSCSNGRRRLRAAASVLLTTSACALLVWSAGASATTSPGQRVDTLVLIENQGITVGESGRLPRGVIVVFYVKNLTKTAKNFKFLGKQTRPIAPGQQEILRVTLVRRGVYPYLSTLNPSKKLRGLFLVY